MLRKSLLCGALSCAVAVTSMPTMAAPLAPAMPQIDNPAVTQVARRVVRRKVVRRGPGFVRNRSVVVRRGPGRFWRGGRNWGGCWNCGWGWDPGFAVGAGIVGFGLGAALAGPGYYGGRCYVNRGGIRYVVDCRSLGY